jgi:cytochrome c6
MRRDRDTPPDREGDPRHRGRDRVRSLREHKLRVSRTFPADGSCRSGKTRWTSIAVIILAAMSAAVGCSESGRQAATTGTTRTTRDAVRPTDAPDPRAGRRIFVATCKRCHTLKLKPRAWQDDRISLAALHPSYSTTVEEVTNGGIAMPSFKGKLSKQEINNLAAFVSRVAARRGARGRDETAFDY